MTMVFYLLIAMTTMYMAYKADYYRKENNALLVRTYMMAAFVILFLCSTFRFNVGNDYSQYVETAHEASVGGYVVTEAGFNWLVRLVYGLCGFECYELVFAIFAFVTLVLFLKAMYEQSVDFSFSFFLFMMLGMYFQTYNTVRYYLALAMALYATRYVLRRDFASFLLWIVLAAFFHKSVLLVLPLYWAASYIWKKWFIITCVIVSAVCMAAQKYVLKLALLLYPSYENTVFLEGGTSVVTLVRCMLVLALYIWYLAYCRKNDRLVENAGELRMYAQLNFLAVLCCVFFSFLPVLTRIVYYLSVNQLLMLPLMLKGIGEERLGRRVKYVVVIACVLYFALFLLTAGQEGVKLSPYRSWLFEENRLS